MRTTRTVSISLAPEQYRRAERLARKQCRTMSELFREGLRRLEEEDRRPATADLRDLGSVLRLIQTSAQATGLDKLTKREIDHEIEAARKESPQPGPRGGRRSTR